MTADEISAKRKVFPLPNAAKRYAQAQADTTRHPWVWYKTKDFECIAEPAAYFKYVNINGVQLEGDIIILCKQEGDPVKEVLWPAPPVIPDVGPILRCTWCCADTATNPCERCGNDHTITDRTIPHIPEWSRRSMQEVECKVCDRRGPYSIQANPAWCDNTNNPKIAAKHTPDENHTVQ